MQFLKYLGLVKKISALAVFASLITSTQADILDEVEYGYADNKGVKIHYVTAGKGPLVVMIHGFPDFLV